MDQRKQEPSFQDRWREARPKKITVFWLCAAAAALTMTVGFTWGGWVTGGTARTMAATLGEEAVVKRLAPICVVRFQADAKRAEKLKELKDMNAWDQGDYVKKQGWATMPGEREPEHRVAAECARLLVAASQ
jgi:hypothetical protein